LENQHILPVFDGGSVFFAFKDSVSSGLYIKSKAMCFSVKNW
jgi:hypothetical protein